VSNSSKGTTSDDEGRCTFSLALQETQHIIISHVSYETMVIESESFPSLVANAVLNMKSKDIDLSQVQVTAKRNGKWKANLKKFRLALLGDGSAAAKCKILNPEVLRFEERDGKFTATAIDLLHIDNDYLGYDLKFKLQELSIAADGSKYYKGNAQFSDKENANDRKIKKRRENNYENSLAHFLRSLIISPDIATLESHGYQLTLEKYDSGVFTQLANMGPQDVMRPTKTPGLYHLYFSEFLTVKHLTLPLNSSETKVAISGAEQQRFGSDRSQTVRGKKEYAVSRLYKIKPYLIVDIRGNIINKADVQEYNFWADLRLSSTLPVDYKKFSDFGPILIPATSSATSIDTLQLFKDLVGSDQQVKEKALQTLQDNWSPGYSAPLLDILRLSNDAWHNREIKKLIEKKAPEIGTDYFSAVQALWKNKPNHSSYYADFKAHIYKTLDPAFHGYFYQRSQETNIRMDEILWGGVKQDGIPPLRNPKMLPAQEAEYLAEEDIVFALVINGKAMAYPQRILAWHELFTDEIGGQPVAGVYCTLCGSLIIYNTEFNEVRHELGTSGFLYRSNKLMYDKATQSLWSTIEGSPVVGPLVGQGIKLETLPVETTTWGAWKNRHPDTQVLSLKTGHNRNYDEGEAYKKYYATDALMFPVPESDDRLLNKSQVFIPRPPGYKENPLAISVEYLIRNGIHQDKIGKHNIIVLTDYSGASRAYSIGDEQLKSYKKGVLKDIYGNVWEVSDEKIINADGRQFLRIPAHNVFWFAWFNVFTDTRLVH